MSTHNAAAGHGHEKAHASVALYVVFAVILCVITFLEWWIFKYRERIGISNQMMVISLLGMSLVKFAMVCGWYMHLRYDNKVLTNMLIAGMVMASGTALVLGIVVHPKECGVNGIPCFKLLGEQAPAPEAAPAAPADGQPAAP